MDCFIVTLSLDVLGTHLTELMEVDHDMIGEPWVRNHFLLDLPGKWDYSQIALDGSDRPIGFAIASVKPGAVHIHRLAVAEAYRRHGIGKALLRSVAEAARGADLPLITLKVSRRNSGAIRLYDRLGFSAQEESSDQVAMCVSVGTLLDSTR